MNDLITTELIEELKATIVEGEFTARFTLIETYHRVGTLIIQNFGDDPVTEVVHGLAVKLDRSERLLWYAIKFARLYPILDTLPEGKNVSWNMVIKQYLTTPQEKEICLHEELITVCRGCGARVIDKQAGL